MENRISIFLIIANKLGSMFQRPNISPPCSITISYSYTTSRGSPPVNTEGLRIPKAYLVDHSHRELNNRRSFYMRKSLYRIVKEYDYESLGLMAKPMIESIYNGKYSMEPHPKDELGSKFHYNLGLAPISRRYSWGFR